MAGLEGLRHGGYLLQGYGNDNILGLEPKADMTRLYCGQVLAWI